MNSKSNNPPKVKTTCPTIISCNTPGNRITTSTDAATAASVTVNTACIDNACIQLNFKALGYLTNTFDNGTVTLVFQLVKTDSCFTKITNNIASPATITFPSSFPASTQIPINLTFCDCYCSSTSCCCEFENGCTVYSIIVTSTGPVALNLNSPILSAITICNVNSFCKNNKY